MLILRHTDTVFYYHIHLNNNYAVQEAYTHVWLLSSLSKWTINSFFCGGMMLLLLGIFSTQNQLKTYYDELQQQVCNSPVYLTLTFPSLCAAPVFQYASLAVEALPVSSAILMCCQIRFFSCFYFILFYFFCTFF